MDAEAVASFCNSISDRPTDGESLARELVKHGRLTEYQAEQIYAGKGKSLVMGNYVILEKLGQGGMGMVLKAEHKRMRRVVALKVMSPVAMKSPDAVKRFRREVEAAARLSHQNIVAAFDADEDRGVHFLVMEFVKGCDLAQVVRQDGPLPLAKALDYTIQAARGLQHAHQQGLVHRDIKPANLLLDLKGTVKILDMGLARICDDALASSEGAGHAGLTTTGTIMGTVDYMSPEQALDTKNADARSDIYSLGVTLYFLLTGRIPFGGDTIMKKLLAHREEPVPSLIKSRPDVPAELQVVFQTMMSKKPADRYQTMSDVISAIQECASGQGFAETTVLPPPPSVGDHSSDTEFRRFLKDRHDETLQTRATGRSDTLKQATARRFTTSVTEAIGKTPDVRRKMLAIGGGIAALVMIPIMLLYVLSTGPGQLNIEITDPEVRVVLEGTEFVAFRPGINKLRVPAGYYWMVVSRKQQSFPGVKLRVNSGETLVFKAEVTDSELRLWLDGEVLARTNVKSGDQ